LNRAANFTILTIYDLRPLLLLWLYQRSTNNFDYVASDTAGKTSTSTRTIIVVAPAIPKPAP
jgi:hypothetical protein